MKLIVSKHIQVYYKYNIDRIEVKWGEMKFFIEKEIINEVLNDFF